jgi:glutamate/tyrosine decarboxylase-like PLP-dependent enzyme
MTTSSQYAPFGRCSLDSEPATFRSDLMKASELVARMHEALPRASVTPNRSRAEIRALFDEPLPEEPQTMDAVLEEFEENIVPNATLSSSPRFFGYINGSGNQVAVIAELLAAAINQIPARWHFSPSASEVERRVVQWLAQFVGYAPDAGGCLLSGGSAGNLAGLATARAQKAPWDANSVGMKGGPDLTVYVSTEGHASLEKSMALLGMGRRHLRRIAVGDDFTIDVDALDRQIRTDRLDGAYPICVVGNAGTTNTGAVDPLSALADVCRAHDVWFHADAAYGGPAAGTDSAKTLFDGLDRADSVIVNPHKWLYVPVEAACILVQRPDALRRTFHIDADYLREDVGGRADERFDFKDYGPQLSRSFRALKVWMTFKIYGARRLRSAIEQNITVMRHLANRIDASTDFVRLAPVPLSVVCFQYRSTDTSRHGDPSYLDGLNERILRALEGDGRVFLSGTTINGKTALRACSVNHRVRQEDADALLEVIRDVAKPLL